MEVDIEVLDGKTMEEKKVEVVERKGIGHPDTLADALAESISIAYSKYTLKKFGKILNHWVDKTVVVGGSATVDWGVSTIVEPISVYVFGKVVQEVGTEEVPIKRIAEETTKKYLKNVLPLLDVEKECKVITEVRSGSGAGREDYWYRPQSPQQLRNIRYTSNDMVICTAYAPLSTTEKLTLLLEEYFNSEEYKKENPDTGTDIKLISLRVGKKLNIIHGVPFIGSLTPTLDYYENRKKEIFSTLLDLIRDNTDCQVTVHFNARDTPKTPFLTAVGTVADVGDCGVVGRGNRINGLITPMREMSIEAPCGKNPVYHAGKIYSVMAYKIAQEIHETLNIENCVRIITKTGKILQDPITVTVQVADRQPAADRGVIAEIVSKTMSSVDGITEEILNGAVLTCMRLRRCIV